MTLLYEQIVEILRADARAGNLPAHVAHMPLTPDTRLADLGVDSLGKMNLLTALMDLTDKYLADDSFNDNHTLGEIATFVADTT